MPTPIIQPSFAAGELAPALWSRVDLAKYHVGLRTCRNFLVSPTGGIFNRTGTQFIGEVKDSRRATRLIPFQFSTQQTYVLEFGHQYLRVIKDGGYVLSGGLPYELATPYAEADLFRLKFTQSADVLTIAHPGYAPRDLTRTGHASWTLTEVAFGSPIEAPTTVTVTAHREFGELGTSNEYAKTWKYVVTAEDADGYESRAGMIGSAQNYQSLGRQDASDGTSKYNWNDVAWTQVPGAVKYHVYKDNAGLLGWIGSTDGLTFRDDNIEADTTVSPLEGRDPFHGPNGITQVAVTSTGSGYTEATEVTVHDVTGSGCVLRPVVAEGKLVSVTVVKPGSGYSSLVSVSASIGSGATFDITVEAAANWPGAVAYFEQRKCWAGSAAHPQSLWTSRSGNYRSMDVSVPTQDDDAISRTIAAQQVHEIRHMVPLTTLLLMTSSGEWKCWSGSGSDVLTPSSTVLKQQSANGCSHVPPVVVGGTVLYTLGSSVRSLAYDWSSDAFAGTDLAVLSSHLMRGRSVVDWAWAAEPDKVVWVVRDDGALLSLTYMKEQDVAAWCRHDTAGGAFESVAVVREGSEDAVYFVVRRTIGGVTKRYVERLHSRLFSDPKDCFFVDCGLTYSGSPTKTLSGLSHLEGQAVAILGDGNVFAPQVVAGGTVKLPQAVSVAHVGLPIQADAATLNPEPGQGTIQGKRKRVTAVTLRVEQTRGLKVGPDADHLTEFKEREGQPYGSPIGLQTGDQKVNIGTTWGNTGSVYIRQSQPLPATILAIIPEIDVGN